MSRYVTVGAVSHSRHLTYSVDEAAPFFEFNEPYIKRAGLMGVEMLAFPEVYYRPDGPSAEVAEEIGGQSSSWAMEMARKYDMHIIWPMLQREGNTVWNSALLIDRKGDLVGVYHKMNPTKGEIEGGIRPGEEANVFETEFGKVGMAICFDLNFRNIFEGLRDNGAELVFFCSAYRGGKQLQAWAIELGFYIVAAIRAEVGRIIDLTGKVLEQSMYETLCRHRINLNRRLLHMDYNWDKMDAMLDKYGTDLSFDYITEEARYAIGSERAGLEIDDVIKEYGLMTLPEYWESSHRVREAALARPRE